MGHCGREREEEVKNFGSCRLGSASSLQGYYLLDKTGEIS